MAALDTVHSATHPAAQTLAPAAAPLSPPDVPVTPALRTPPADLFREQAFVDGRWRDAEAETVVLNPADGSRVGRVPNLTTADVAEAVRAARTAGRSWAALLPQERADVLLDWYALIVEAREELAVLMVLEQGKSLDEARGEIDYGASFVRWFAEEARRTGGETIASHLPGRQLWTVRAPVGVVACVTPWNFPSAMLTRKGAAALAAGCTVVAAPSMETPFSALALAELAVRAGFPAGVFSVVTGEPATVVGTLADHGDVAALSFTGSTEIGRMLGARCAATVKRVSMELGGHAPFLAFDDVDIDTLVAGAIDAKFMTSGQDCLAANRILVPRRIYREFTARFVAATEALKVGDGFDPDAVITPLIHGRAADKVHAQVEDAVAHGARLLTGGQRHPAGDAWYLPTVLADVSPSMRIWSEETFGPVAAITPFDDEREALALANDTHYGLAAYVWTRDVDRITRLTRSLEFGMVAVNGVKMTGPPIPFGGLKQSGLGREGGKAGIDEFLETKYVCLNTLDAG